MSGEDIFQGTKIGVPAGTVLYCQSSTLQSLKTNPERDNFPGQLAGELQPRVGNIECELAQVQVLSRSTYQEWGHCQVRDDAHDNGHD